MSDLLRALAAEAAPEVVARAVADGRAEVKEILQRRFVEALLAEVGAAPLATGTAPRPTATGAPGTTTGEAGGARGAGDAAGTGEGAVNDAGAPRPAAGPAGSPRTHGGRHRRPNGPGRGGHRATGSGCYLYGIAWRGGPADLAGLRGIDGAPVEEVPAGRVAAIVSRVTPDLEKWGVAEDGDADLSLLGPRLAEHESVLDELVDSCTVVPMRFGTMYPTDADLARVLAAHEGAVAEALEAIDGRVEWGLSVRWQPPPAAPEPVAAPPVAEPGAAPGRGYLRRREAERSAARDLDATRSRLAAAVHVAAEGEADAFVLGAGGRPGSGGDGLTILKGAYLVRKERSERFRVAVAAALSEAGAGLDGELTGPWPAYNFVHLRLEETPV